MTRRVGVALSLFTSLLIAASSGGFAESHARIVRVSYLDGHVQIDRAGVQGLEKAILNTPVVQGTHIVTGHDGLAEVEFEDQSAVRLAENSDVRFRQLSMNDAGAKVNEIEVVKGTVYFDVHSRTADVYRVEAEGNTFLIHRDTQARLSASPEQLRAAVFKGNVELTGQPQLVSVRKKETLSLDPNHPSGFAVTSGVETLPVDAWNTEREAYANSYARNTGLGGPKSGFGLQDLNYYGNFFYTSGLGYVWQPFGFAGYMAGWDPYSNGAWSFYPGMGYMWSSAYPWGWLPYHFGSWAFIGGVGWAWVPGSYGNQWYANNFQMVPKVTKAPAGWTPALPPASLTSSAQPTVLVGRAAGTAAVIPGGRLVPNFASVIQGRASAAAFEHGTVGLNSRSASTNGNVFAGKAASPEAVHRGSGHVFAAPAGPAISSSGGGVGLGSPAYGGTPVGMGSSGMGAGRSGAASGGAAAGHGGGSHGGGSPK